MANNSTFKQLAALVGAVVLGAQASAGAMVVGDYLGNRCVRVDDRTGAVLGVAAQGGGLNRPLGFAYGPDGYLYVSSYATNSIKRFDTTGTFVDDYALTQKPHGLTFYDGDIIVSNHNTGRVSRIGLMAWQSAVNPARMYHSVVVKEQRVFVSFASNSGGGIEEFDPATGQSLGDFVLPIPGMRDVQGFGWSAENKLYVASSNQRQLLVFDGVSGQSLGTMPIAGTDPLGVRFGSSGELVTSTWGDRTVKKYSPSFQRIMGTLVNTSAGLIQPWYMERSNPTIECRAVFSGWASAAPPATEVTIVFSNAGQGNQIETRTVPITVGNGSYFRFDVPSPQYLERYDILVKVGTYLSSLRSVDTRDMSLSFASFTFTNGDCDGSNVVDALDYMILINAMGSSSADTNWDPRADLDGDGVVSSSDAALFHMTFARKGES